MIQISLNREDELELVQMVNCRAGSEKELTGWQADYWCEKDGFKWMITLRLGDMDMKKLQAQTKVTIGDVEDSGLFYEISVAGNTNSKIILDKEKTKA